MAKTKEVDLTHGSIFKKLFLFAVPFIFTNILQILFNAADIAVVGIFVNDDAVAAVGANTALITLLTGFFVGLSIGANVVLSRYAGKRDREAAMRTVGTSIMVALVAGIALMLIGVLFTREFITLMNCDPRIMDQAETYLKIYFFGIPIMLVYNFAASLLRAAGDTKRPLIYLCISGVVNVALNVFFVVVCKMTVEGVAIATISSWSISAVLCLIALFRSKEYASLRLKYLRFFKIQLKEVLLIGIPSGLQSVAFSISNVLIQSTINSYGATAMSANTTAAQFDGIIYNIGNAISMSCMSFIGQNVGARKMFRVKKVIFCSIILILMLQLSVGLLFTLLAPVLCSIIVSGEDVIALACQRLSILCPLYFMCGIMEILGNACRAMGKPIVSFIISVMGATVFRIIFMELTLMIWPGFATIYWSYPASWIFTIAMYLCFTPSVYKKLKARIEKTDEQNKVQENTEELQMEG